MLFSPLRYRPVWFHIGENAAESCGEPGARVSIFQKCRRSHLNKGASFTEDATWIICGVFTRWWCDISGIGEMFPQPVGIGQCLLTPPGETPGTMSIAWGDLRDPAVVECLMHLHAILVWEVSQLQGKATKFDSDRDCDVGHSHSHTWKVSQWDSEAHCGEFIAQDHQWSCRASEGEQKRQWMWPPNLCCLKQMLQHHENWMSERCWHCLS